MTPFERAVVTAYLARRQHGVASSEYQLALQEMEERRPVERFCARCGGRWPQHRRWCRQEPEA